MGNVNGRPVGPDGEELYQCDNCDQLWLYDDLETAHDLYERITDGEPMSSVECPACGGLAFPAKGSPMRLISPIVTPTQTALLSDHLERGHHVNVQLVGNGPLDCAFFCDECGNAITRTVKKDELGDPDSATRGL